MSSAKVGMMLLAGYFTSIGSVGTSLGADGPQTLLLQDFRQGTFDERKLKYVNRNHWSHIVPEAGGVRISFGAGEPDMPLRGLYWRKDDVRGDFEISMSYEILEAENAASGSPSELFIRVHLPDAPSSATAETVTLSRSMRPGSGNQFSIYHARGTESSQEFSIAKTFPAHALSGKLRIKRTGSTVSYLVAEAKAKEFAVLYEEPMVTDDVHAVQFAATNGGMLTRYHVRILDVEVKGRKAIWTPKRGYGWLWFPGLLAAAVFGFLLWRWKWREE
jgi:hypothetical protein